MASEVTSDFNSEISGLNNPCSSAFLAPLCFLEPFFRKKEGRNEGQNGHVDLRAIAAGKKHSIKESNVHGPLTACENRDAFMESC